ncbi:TetR/AcrR family transcriptional regulator [uncultured Pseudodesulfovibrio sp.]|uniref:TetR/AcrR family transcriptional regulator n=1 Tax=uncultured Pseudodesulfovibrio sp. TaxID=2035858 RepID=UPI0029C8153D|nr:TetR/AcrR family transcriptional regulator [uncultured Pseudodesulfovibrio sp.]
MVEKRNPQDVRKAILEAANTCFAEMGVKKATLSKIADRAGVTVHDITSFFGNKSLLILNAQNEEIDHMQQEYLEKMPDASLGETVKFIIRTRLDFVETHKDQTKLFVTNALMGREPWSSGLDQVIWRLSIEFATLFEKGVRNGEIRKDANVNAAVRAIISFYLTSMVTVGIRAADFNADTVFSFMEPQIDLLLDGLRT